MFMEKKYNICLLGCSLDTGNKGVSALAASLAKIILEIIPHAYISLLIGNRSSRPQEIILSGKSVLLDVVNYRLSLKAKIHEHLLFILFLSCLYRCIPIQFVRNMIIKSNKWVRTVINADFIGDIFGGDSFSDIYGIKRFILESIPRFTLVILKKKLVFLPQTFGPYKTRIAKFIARKLMNNAYCLLYRDTNGNKIIKKIVNNKNDNKTIQFCPDVAFILESRLLEILDIKPKIVKTVEVPIIGLNVNGLLFNGGYTRNNMFSLKLDYREFIYQLIEVFLSETNARFLLIPHNFGAQGNINNDFDACSEVYTMLQASYSKRIHIVVREYDQHEIKGIIGLCNFFIGSRMHACIAALSQRIPAIGLAYSKKFIGVFKSVGMGSLVIDARCYDIDQAIVKIREIYQFFAYGKNLMSMEKIKELKAQVITIFRKILYN
jgi:polysaccharide pyruvyl transferase WcaK-like protein